MHPEDPLGETWRLLPLEAHTGPENMAIDEALIASIGEGGGLPALRFYSWRSPWVSLGPSQSASDLDRIACQERGWGVLRRASGGMAVLHRGQVAYALVLPSSHPVWEGDLVASYLRFGQPLQRAFRSLGVSAELAPPGANQDFTRGAPILAPRTCFGALGAYELVCQGYKLIGNSQIRRRHASTQHGVIQLSGDQSQVSAVMAHASDEERAALGDYLHTHVGAVDRCAGHPVSALELTKAVVSAFTEAFNVCLEPATLTPFERARADELTETKYGNDEWTYRR